MPDNERDAELVVQQEGCAVQVTMNRPSALNALSLEMIRLFTAGLERWESDENAKAVFIIGAGDKAFCAGGDVKSSYKTGMSYRRGEADARVLSLFFREEYLLNRQLFHFKKPLVAFMNGITMGGGFGIAGPCRYRVACESTVFAMPETGIGFFPDVGSTYFLNRAPGEAGACIALTGGSFGPEDMLFCGLATHFIPLEKHEECREAISGVINKGDQSYLDNKINAILSKFHVKPDAESVLRKNRDIVDKCFTGNKVQPIIDNLNSCGSRWAEEQADIIESRSPVSLKVSLSHLRMTKNMSFDAITAQDFILAQHFMQGHDFYEGVRAVLVDKDRQPKWEPESLEEVSQAAVQEYFMPTGLDLDEIAARSKIA